MVVTSEAVEAQICLCIQLLEVIVRRVKEVGFESELEKCKCQAIKYCSGKSSKELVPSDENRTR